MFRSHTCQILKGSQFISQFETMKTISEASEKNTK